MPRNSCSKAQVTGYESFPFMENIQISALYRETDQFIIGQLLESISSHPLFKIKNLLNPMQEITHRSQNSHGSSHLFSPMIKICKETKLNCISHFLAVFICSQSSSVARIAGVMYQVPVWEFSECALKIPSEDMEPLTRCNAQLGVIPGSHLNVFLWASKYRQHTESQPTFLSRPLLAHYGIKPFRVGKAYLEDKFSKSLEYIFP